MADDNIDGLLEEIGQIVANASNHAANPVLLYAEVETNMVSYAVFWDAGNHIAYRDPRGLTYPLLDLWEATEPTKRWAEMEYLLHDGTFTASFVFTEEIDRSEDHFDRRDRIVQKYLGTKPIVYPQPNEDNNESWKFEL